MEEDGKSTNTNKPGMVARLMELKKRRQHIANGKLINIYQCILRLYVLTCNLYVQLEGPFVVVIIWWFDLHLHYLVVQWSSLMRQHPPKATPNKGLPCYLARLQIY